MQAAAHPEGVTGRVAGRRADDPASDAAKPPRPAPSLRANSTVCGSAGGGVGGVPPAPRPTAAFCLTGQPRTFIHPEAQRTIKRAIRSFGAHAYVFFHLTNDDEGSSYAHPPLLNDARLVHDAMASLRPKVASYAAPASDSGTYAAARRAQCGLPPEGRTWAIGGRLFMRTFYQTHAKLRSCFEQVVRYEERHQMRFDWVVRMRPDVWFFDASLVPHCELAADRISFPVGVVGCGYSPCINDHMAFMPRALAPYYFNIADDLGTCDGVRDLSRHWKNYNVWRLMSQNVPLAAPSPLIPYTLLRPCSNDSLASFYPECQRWSSGGRLIEKNAGLAHYANGSALPGLAQYREERVRRYAQCRQAATEAFPSAFSFIDGGEFDRARIRSCAANVRRHAQGGRRL